MRFTLGYSIWNKVDMLTWLLEGIVANYSPTNTDIVFHFDACVDQSETVIDMLIPYWLHQRGKWAPEQITKLVSATEVRELGGHNRILTHFMERQENDFCIIAQDDQHFLSTPCPFLEKVAATYGDKLGLIGGRDAYTANYTNFTGSMWSESNVKRRVRHGEFVPLPYMNSGPVVYNRNLVSKVGYLDDGFLAYYVWDDYGARAHKLGFVNGVMGMDLIHAKFGRAMGTTWLSSAADLNRLRSKHGWGVI